MSEANPNPSPNPAPNPDPNPAPNPDPAPAPSPEPASWTSGLNDEVKGWVENKGFKDTSALIDSYRNFEKLMGVPKDRLLKLPERSDDPAWKDIYGRLGRPEDPKDYDLSAIKDEKFGEVTKNAFHELGVTKAQGEALAGKWKEYFEGQAQARKEAADNKARQEEENLKKEWGQALETNIKIGERAASVFGLDADTIDALEKAMGYEKTMKFMHMVGSKLGEGTFVAGQGAGNGGVLTPQAAQEQINRLMKDPDFSSKYISGNVEAREKMESLQKMATFRPS